MSLQQWLDNAWIKRVRPSGHVVESLLAIAEREIGDASLEGISVDGRFDHSYDAIRSLCEVALHASGYEVPRGGRKHERVIESLKFTVDGPWTDEVDLFDRSRRLRHQSIYERIGVVQQQDADDLLRTARRLLEGTREWLDKQHPELV
jgi:hypothetical protein